MLLRAALVMLVMLNLGAALWWISGAQGAVAPPAAVTADAPQLRLLHEAVPAPVETTTPAQPMPAAAEPSSGSGVAGARMDVPAAPVCLRFGPFADAGASQAAGAALARVGVRTIARQTPARATRGWKVVTSPFASREAAVAMAERLRAAGVSDLYVMGEGPDANSIALGRYGSEDAARRRRPTCAARASRRSPSRWVAARCRNGWTPASPPAPTRHRCRRSPRRAHWTARPCAEGSRGVRPPTSTR